jgi:hypothetical protein
VVVVLGVVIGLLLALISLARLEFVDGSPKLTARTPVEWVSTSMVRVTQPGFPEGYALLDETLGTPKTGLNGDTPQPRFSDPSRYSALAGLYVEFAKSDPLERLVLRGTGPDTRYDALTVKTPDGSAVLPLIAMVGYGPSGDAAAVVANRATTALRRYIGQLQVRNGVPADKRVELVVMSRASKAEVFKPRSLVRPIFLFMLPALLAVGLAFLLENLRPSVKRGPGEVHKVTPREEAQGAPRDEPQTERVQRTA